jgi:hypothetical protein
MDGLLMNMAGRRPRFSGFNLGVLMTMTRTFRLCSSAPHVRGRSLFFPFFLYLVRDLVSQCDGLL